MLPVTPIPPILSSESAQADFAAAGHPGANSFASPVPASNSHTLCVLRVLCGSISLIPSCSSVPFVSFVLNPYLVPPEGVPIP